MDEFLTEFGDYPDMFENVLREAATDNIEFSVYDVANGHYPDAVGECDGYIITGSRKSVYDDEAWIHRLREYVVELHETRTRLVGICFGHQIVATALGGNTEAVGWAVGVHESQILIRQDFMQPYLKRISALVSHRDQVTRLPREAELLASSDYCPNAMYRIGDHILTFQGHPEFCKPYSKVLMDMRRELLDPDIYCQGIESLDKDIQNEVLAKWMLRFLMG